MYDLLKKLMKLNELIAIYTNKNDYDSFAVGYIYQIHEDKVIILHVGIHGEFDGYSACFIKDIFRTETNSKYLKKIKKLINWKISDVINIKTGEDCFSDLIKHALEHNSILAVSCYDEEVEIRGYITNYSAVLLEILQITEYGEEDGKTTIYIEDINKVVIEDVECVEIDKLYHYNKI